MLPNEKRDITMGKLSMSLYLDNIVKKYKMANRREKGEILEELCIVSGYPKRSPHFKIKKYYLSY